MLDRAPPEVSTALRHQGRYRRKVVANRAPMHQCLQNSMDYDALRMAGLDVSIEAAVAPKEEQLNLPETMPGIARVRAVCAAHAPRLQDGDLGRDLQAAVGGPHRAARPRAVRPAATGVVAASIRIRRTRACRPGPWPWIGAAPGQLPHAVRGSTPPTAYPHRGAVSLGVDLSTRGFHSKEVDSVCRNRGTAIPL